MYTDAINKEICCCTRARVPFCLIQFSFCHKNYTEGSVLQHSLHRTGPTEISLIGHNAVAAMSTKNHLPTFHTLRWLIAWWVLELLEIVLICCHIYIVLGIEAFTAHFAGLPGTSMTLIMMKGTERVAIVIAPTAIAGIRKHHIRAAIIAYPLVTTRRFG
jgi:hypothetical protein